MARKTTNLAALEIDSHLVQHIVACTYDVPERPIVQSDALTDGEIEVMGVGAVGGPRTIDVTVEADSEDTNGQGVLLSGFDDGQVVENVVFYREGKVNGSPMESGSVFVYGPPRRGSSGNENKTRKEAYKLVWTAKPTPGTYTA